MKGKKEFSRFFWRVCVLLFLVDRRRVDCRFLPRFVVGVLITCQLLSFICTFCHPYKSDHCVFECFLFMICF